MKLSVFLVCGALTAPALLAQETGFGVERFASHVTLSLFGATKANLEDTAGSFRISTGSVDASFSLYSDPAVPPRTFPSFRLVGNVGFLAGPADISFLTRRHTVYRADVRPAAIWAVSDRDIFLVSIGAGFSEDQETIRNPRLRATALVLGNHRASETRSYQYGLAYSYVFGRGRLLPLAGFRWRPAPDWLVSAMVPFVISVRHGVSSGAAVGLLVAPHGNEVRFSNSGDFPGQPDTVHFRLRELKIGGEADLRIARSVLARLEAGALVARQLRFADGDNEFLKTSLRPAAYAQLTLRWSFGEPVSGHPRPGLD